METIQITRTADSYTARGTVRYYLDDAELKQAGIDLAAQFPKVARVGLYRDVEVEPGQRSRAYLHLGMNVKLSADAANGGQNETGVKRIASFERAAAKLGIELV